MYSPYTPPAEDVPTTLEVSTRPSAARARLLELLVAGALFLVGSLNAGFASAGSVTGSNVWGNPFGCDVDLPSRAEWARSDAALDLYNGLAFIGIAGGITFGGKPNNRWSAVNDLDSGVRDGLRLGSTNERRNAAMGSDIALGISIAALPVLSIGAHQSRTRDCMKSLDMMTDFVESLGLTLMITQSVKLAAGRTRPYTRDCAPRDASCDDDDRFKSFVSGHSSLAATGAGLTCAFAIKREAWGSSLMAKAAPCGLGIATALTAGTLRVAADRHWATDVAVGFAIGAAVGYFDTWGPFDLLKFRKLDARGEPLLSGIITPTTINGKFGAQLLMTF